eukprot:g3929.t1
MSRRLQRDRLKVEKIEEVENVQEENDDLADIFDYPVWALYPLLLGLYAIAAAVLFESFLVVEKLELYGSMSWWTVGVPLFLAEGLVLVSQIVALLVARYSSSIYFSMQNLRELAAYSMFKHFFGILPTIPSLAMMVWFHVNITVYLESNDVTAISFKTMFPLYIFLVAQVLSFIIFEGGVPLNISTLICFLSAAVLVQVNTAEGRLRMPWMLAASPLLLGMIILFSQVAYLIVQDRCYSKWGRVRFLKNSQRICIRGTAVGLFISTVGIAMLCMLPDSADEAPSVRSVAYVFQIGLALACIAFCVNATIYVCGKVEETDQPLLQDAKEKERLENGRSSQKRKNPPDLIYLTAIGYAYVDIVTTDRRRDSFVDRACGFGPSALTF